MSSMPQMPKLPALSRLKIFADFGCLVLFLGMLAIILTKITSYAVYHPPILLWGMFGYTVLLLIALAYGSRKPYMRDKNGVQLSYDEPVILVMLIFMFVGVGAVVLLEGRLEYSIGDRLFFLLILFSGIFWWWLLNRWVSRHTDRNYKADWEAYHNAAEDYAEAQARTSKINKLAMLLNETPEQIIIAAGPRVSAAQLEVLCQMLRLQQRNGLFPGVAIGLVPHRSGGVDCPGHAG